MGRSCLVIISLSLILQEETEGMESLMEIPV